MSVLCDSPDASYKPTVDWERYHAWLAETNVKTISMCRSRGIDNWISFQNRSCVRVLVFGEFLGQYHVQQMTRKGSFLHANVVRSNLVWVIYGQKSPSQSV